MRTSSWLLKIAGKDNFDIDPNVGTGYILRLCWKYGLMMLRGKIIAIFHKQIASDIFVGGHVTLYEKRKLQIGSKTKIHDRCKIDALSTNGVVIGNHVVLGERTCIECTGSLQNLGKGVVIGNRSTFATDCFFGAAGGIEIGEDVMVGQYVRFHSENHRYDNVNTLINRQGVTHKGIKIGNNCWIGAGAIFLDGAKIGDGCVVAANTVVTKKFGDDFIIAGVPAKVIKKRC